MTAWILAVLGLTVTTCTQVAIARVAPTLDRRIRDHAALLKDLPDGIAGPLSRLLSEELDLLIARERRRLWVRVEQPGRRSARRGVLTVAGVVTAVVIAGAPRFKLAGAHTDASPSWSATVAVYLAVVMISAAVVNSVRLGLALRRLEEDDSRE